MRKSFLVGTLLLILPVSAEAYCNRLPRLICAEYANSGAVVTAKLVSVKHYVSPDKQDWYIYTLQADKILRGQIDSEFRVYEENSSGRAPFNWIEGQSYLLFLNSRDDGTWWLYGCGNSTSLKGAIRILDAIDSIKSRKGGFIQGIVGGTGQSIPLRKAQVTIKSDSATYRVVPGNSGRFGLRVPAGRYVIQISLPGWSFEKDPLDSYEDPKNVTIEDGGCAEVSFTAEQKP